MAAPLGEMELADVLDSGIRLLFRRLASLLTITLIAFSPVIALQIILPLVGIEPPRNDPDPKAASANFIEMGRWIALVGLFATVMMVMAQGAILKLVTEDFEGRRIGPFTALRFALSKFASLFVAGLTFGLIVTLGMMLCCIPGVVTRIWFGFVAQAVVSEDKGPFQAFGRSKQLVEGNFWRVFLVVFILNILYYVLGTIAGVLEFVFPRWERLPAEKIPGAEVVPFLEYFPYSDSTSAFLWTNHVVLTVFSSMVEAIATAFFSVCLTLLYLDLRIRKEGYDLELAMRPTDEEEA